MFLFNEVVFTFLETKELNEVVLGNWLRTGVGGGRPFPSWLLVIDDVGVLCHNYQVLLSVIFIQLMCRKWQTLRYLAQIVSMSVMSKFLVHGRGRGPNYVQKVLCSKTRDPLSDLLYLKKPLPVLGRVVWSGVHPDKMYNNQKINYMTKSLSKILLEKMALEKMLDYKFESTFWEEFSIAENYGPDGVREHYDLVFSQWKDNIKFLTELVLVLNLKLFIWFKVDDDLGKMYEDLYVDADAYALSSFEGDDLHYYLHTLD